MCRRMVGKRQVSMSRLYERQVKRKARAIARDPRNTSAKHYQLLPPGRRSIMPELSTTRAARSFAPQSIQLVNNQNMA